MCLLHVRRPSAMTPHPWSGRSSRRSIHPEDRWQLSEMRAVAMSAGGPTTKLLRIRAKSGAYVWMETTGCAVRGAATGQLIGLETVARDVTAGTRSEADRERLVRGWETRTVICTTLCVGSNERYASSGTLNRLKDDFVATVSHELRTPLTSIVGYAEILGDGDLGALDDDQHRVLDVMDQNARRLLTLVEDLLTMGRIDAGIFPCSRAPLRLGPLVESCGAAVMPTARSKGVELVINVEPEVGTIVGDAAQLDRLMLNLLGNALKFTPPHGRACAHRMDGIRRDRHRGRGQWNRDPDRRAGSGVLSLLPNPTERRRCGPRHGSRSRDREVDRRPARRADLSRFPTRAGNHDHGRAPRIFVPSGSEPMGGDAPIANRGTQ